MPFTPTQFAKITDALRSKFKEECPSCSHKNFSIPDGLVMLVIQPLSQQQGLALGGQSLPSIPLVCTNCGYTLLFNALVLGLAEELGLKTAEKKEVPANG